MTAMDMRMFDSAIARWVVQDPVVHHFQSPYNGFDGNPVYWADPSGADADNSTNRFDYDGLGRARYDEHGWYIDPTRRGQARPDVLEMLAAIDKVSGGGSFVGGILDLGDLGFIRRTFLGNADIASTPDNGDSELSEVIIKPMYSYEFVSTVGYFNTLAGISFLMGQGVNESWSKEVFKYGQRINGKVRSNEVLTRANRITSLKWATRFSKLGLVSNVFGTLISFNNIKNDLSNGKKVNNWDIADATVGTIASASSGASLAVAAGLLNPASLGAAAFLVSNPVGWGVAIVATAYFSYRLYSDLTKE